MKYPRPQLKRDNFQSLDGEWLMNGNKVIVPSCQLEQNLLYEKEFEFKKIKDRVILHFGAVDQICSITLNGINVGKHYGGYLPFEFDISNFVVEGTNKLMVNVLDVLDTTYPYGKQTLKPSGMWYTPVTGIWKSVWLEQVPQEYITDLKIKTDLKGVDLKYFINNGEVLEKRIDIDNPILWTYDNPHLYYDELIYKEDKVEFYYGLRTIEIKNINGINRVCLNGEPIFINGVLDQGYWKDSLFIPDSEDGYELDILRMKKLGFNTLRKHIKIEDEQFYYDCDRLGMLVIQDMVENGKYSFIKDTVFPTIGISRKDNVAKLDSRQEFFIKHSKQTLDYLYNHPSIIIYTIFNEGWGQFNADELYEMLKDYDDSRLYDATSGWFKQNKSDFDSQHVYFRTKDLKVGTRPFLLSECGGFVLQKDDAKATWGYGKCNSEQELTNKIIEMYEKMVISKIEKGLCGVIYTQLSDVEGEVNGLYTFDRKVCKVIPEKLLNYFNGIYEKMRNLK